MTDAPPLAGLRVFEACGGVAAAYACQLLGDLGADVRKRVTAPDGAAEWDETVRVALDRNKQLVDATPGTTDWDAAVAWADIVIAEGDADHLETVLPGDPSQGPIWVALTGFGLTGPRRDWRASELVSMAYGGALQQNGEPGRPPLRAPAGVGEAEVGLNAAVAALIAHWAGPGGQIVDIAAADTWATLQTAVGLLEFIFQGRVAQRSGRSFHGRPYPYTILRAKDGLVRLICLTGQEWQRSVAMMGSPAWATDERYTDRRRNAEELHDEVDALVEQWLASRTGDDVLESAMAHKVPWAPLRRLDEVLGEPQLRSRGFFWHDGQVDLPGSPARFGRTPVTLRSPAPPAQDSRPGRELPARERAGRGGTAEGGLPLAGIRVLDFGWAWAGGVVGSVLADFGADVIKVESRRRLDPMRQDRPLIGDQPDIEQGGLHHNVNRGKRSVAIDIGDPRGAALVGRLAADADVLIENLSPGALDRRGLGYADLAARNPRLIYLSLGAVGREGPLAGIRAYAPVITALSGVDALTGYEGEAPIGVQHGFADPNASLHGTLAVLAALHERERSGRGQLVDVSQLETMVSLLGPQLAALQMGRPPAPEGNSHPGMAPHGVYPAAGQDEWVAIACPDDAAWSALRKVLGEPDWAGAPELASAEGRLAARATLDRHLSEWTGARDRWEAARTLQAAGVPAAPLLDTSDRFSDDHLQARECYVVLDHPVIGTEFVYGVPWKLSATPGGVRRRVPLLGEHTEEVLRELLGIEDSEYRRLEEVLR